MNILGVGLFEFALIFLIMLMVAGPKRMVRWAYILGRYTAQARGMFQETVNALQKEFEAEVNMTKEIAGEVKKVPTGSFDIVREANKLISEQPIDAAKSSGTGINTPATPPSDKPSSDDKPGYGTWQQK